MVRQDWPLAHRAGISTAAASCSSHTGDGVCAAFSSPRSAVYAAVAAQLALELPVRMGIPLRALENDQFRSVAQATPSWLIA